MSNVGSAVSSSTTSPMSSRLAHPERFDLDDTLPSVDNKPINTLSVNILSSNSSSSSSLISHSTNSNSSDFQLDIGVGSGQQQQQQQQPPQLSRQDSNVFAASPNRSPIGGNAITLKTSLNVSLAAGEANVLKRRNIKSNTDEHSAVNINDISALKKRIVDFKSQRLRAVKEK